MGPPVNKTAEKPTRSPHSITWTVSVLCAGLQDRATLPTKMENQNKTPALQEHVQGHSEKFPVCFPQHSTSSTDKLCCDFQIKTKRAAWEGQGITRTKRPLCGNDSLRPDAAGHTSSVRTDDELVKAISRSSTPCIAD